MMFSHYEACPRCIERGKDSRRDNLAVWKDGGRHCFSCGYHHNPSIIHRWNKSIEELEAKTKRILPDDFTWEVPARCWEWLLQYGLPYEYWQRKVGYSPKYERLVFRVGNPLLFSIGRFFGASSTNSRKWYLWGECHKSVVPISSGSTTVLVEDLLSAHKVGQVTTAVPLFGTHIHPAVLYYLRQKGEDIILWLDSDQFPEVYAKAKNLQILTGCKVSVIYTEQDPKCLTTDEIYARINSS